MKLAKRIVIPILIILATYSCYHKELQYSFTPSKGGVSVGNTLIYLAEAKEFQTPKGISRFPDGGQSRVNKEMFGLFKTDTSTSTTVLIARLDNVSGWPSRYSTRLEKNLDYVAVGIINVTMKDSVNGIYLYNIKKGELQKYSNLGALPTLSADGYKMAYCNENKLIIEDIKFKTLLVSYLLNAKPAFLSWKNDSEILIFYSAPFSVELLNINTGKIIKTDLKYQPNYSQEFNATQINNIVRIQDNSIRELLSNH